MSFLTLNDFLLRSNRRLKLLNDDIGEIQRSQTVEFYGERVFLPQIVNYRWRLDRQDCCNKDKHQHGRENGRMHNAVSTYESVWLQVGRGA